MAKLFDPIQVGSITAKNRIFMGPMTRTRASRNHVPTPIMAEYYAQRSGAGLIFSEAAGISKEGLGTPFAPGIWSQEQVEAWKLVTKAVHDNGGKIALQLWHMGRATHSAVTGMQPVSASATTFPEQIHTYEGKQDPEEARPLTKEDIKRIVKDYGVAAKNAIDAGFDGVQIHGANGYLIDQFLRDSANFRTDEYGGSIENRARLLEEVVAEVAKTIGGDKTHLRLSPNGDTFGVIDSNPEKLFAYVADMLNKYNLASLELREVGSNGTFGATDQPKVHDTVRKHYKGVLGLNQDYTREQAIKEVEDGTADFIVFGRPYIGTPDLAERIEKNLPWSDNSMATWYGLGVNGSKGYTDYPKAQA